MTDTAPPMAAPEGAVDATAAPPSAEDGAAPSVAAGHPMAGIAMGERSLDLLHGVEMTVTVELGRTKMLLRDLLALQTGSVIELDRAAGSPVDVLINDNLLARGEVVVLDDEFGVRILDIVMTDAQPARSLNAVRCCHPQGSLAATAAVSNTDAHVSVFSLLARLLHLALHRPHGPLGPGPDRPPQGAARVPGPWQPGRPASGRRAEPPVARQGPDPRHGPPGRPRRPARRDGAEHHDAQRTRPGRLRDRPGDGRRSSSSKPSPRTTRTAGRLRRSDGRTSRARLTTSAQVAARSRRRPRRPRRPRPPPPP